MRRGPDTLFAGASETPPYTSRCCPQSSSPLVKAALRSAAETSRAIPIISLILDRLKDSIFIVADITYLNQNVVYEMTRS